MKTRVVKTGFLSYWVQISDMGWRSYDNFFFKQNAIRLARELTRYRTLGEYEGRRDRTIWNSEEETS